MEKTIGQNYAPRRVVFAIPNDAQNLPGVLAHRKPTDTPVAYVCAGTSCSEPIDNLEALEKEIA